MEQRLWWAIGIVALLLLIFIIGSITAINLQSSQHALSLTPKPTLFSTPTPNLTPILSSTPSATTTFQGIILGINGHPVAYKNSTIITVQRQDGTSVSVYINIGTTITDMNNQIMDLPQLSTGMRVTIQGKPVAGGIDAKSMKVLTNL